MAKKKKNSPVPTEPLSQANSEYTLRLFCGSSCTAWLLESHFLDESSVIVKAGNRVYGNSYLGEPVIKFQRYASNANYTLNLLHSIHGVDYFLNFKFNLIYYSKPFRWTEQMEQQYLKTVIWSSWTIVGFTTDISLQSPHYETFYKNIVLICCSNLLTRPS